MRQSEFRKAVEALNCNRNDWIEDSWVCNWVAHYKTTSRGDVEASIQLPPLPRSLHGYESCRTRWYQIRVTPRPELRETHVQIDEFHSSTGKRIEEINPDYAFPSRGEAFDYASEWLSKAEGIRVGNILA